MEHNFVDIDDLSVGMREMDMYGMNELRAYMEHLSIGNDVAVEWKIVNCTGVWYMPDQINLDALYARFQQSGDLVCDGGTKYQPKKFSVLVIRQPFGMQSVMLVFASGSIISVKCRSVAQMKEEAIYFTNKTFAITEIPVIEIRSIVVMVNTFRFIDLFCMSTEMDQAMIKSRPCHVTPVLMVTIGDFKVNYFESGKLLIRDLRSEEDIPSVIERAMSISDMYPMNAEMTAFKMREMAWNKRLNELYQLRTQWRKVLGEHKKMLRKRRNAFEESLTVLEKRGMEVVRESVRYSRRIAFRKAHTKQSIHKMIVDHKKQRPLPPRGMRRPGHSDKRLKNNHE